MKKVSVRIFAGQVPWSQKTGIMDISNFSGGWQEAMANMDALGWRLSLYTLESDENEENAPIVVREFPIVDKDKEPKFLVGDLAAPEQIFSSFDKMFGKFLGKYDKVEKEDIPSRFEEAMNLLEAGKKRSAYKIIKNIGLSLYYNQEKKRYFERAKAHFEGVDFDCFQAADCAQARNATNITVDDVLYNMEHYDFGDGVEYSHDSIVKKIKITERKLSEVVPTIDKYRLSGEKNTAEYTPERTELHLQILQELIYDNLEAYIPKNGEQPTFILLGGRGGSGKSKFKGLVYNNDFVVLDADAIKEKLPEYRGWNALEVHEESSDILEQALLICQQNGLNVVVDATMHSAKSVERRLKLFKDGGYQVEAHYMFLPPQKAAQRAVARFLTGGQQGRYVPVEVVLANQENEQNFDRIKDNVDAWSLYDGDVDYGKKPSLLMSGKGMSYMDKRKSKYFFDIDDINLNDGMSQNISVAHQLSKLELGAKL